MVKGKKTKRKSNKPITGGNRTSPIGFIMMISAVVVMVMVIMRMNSQNLVISNTTHYTKAKDLAPTIKIITKTGDLNPNTIVKNIVWKMILLKKFMYISSLKIKLYSHLSEI